MSNFTQFVSGTIKSTQRGTILINGTTSNTATITSVDTAKTQLRYLGNDTSDSVGNNQNAMVKIVLTDSTTVTASRYSNTGTAIASWELTEYY